jgi:hypothetical protein
MARAAGAPIITVMNSSKPFRRYVLVDRREAGTGIRRMKLARVTGLLEVASCAPAPVKRTTTA